MPNNTLLSVNFNSLVRIRVQDLQRIARMNKDSTDSRDKSRCLRRIFCTERFCKDIHCKDIHCKDTGRWPQGSLLKRQDWTQNRSHSPKTFLLVHLVFALLFSAFIFPPIPTTPTNFSQRCLLGNRNPNCLHCYCFLGERQCCNIRKLFCSCPYYLPKGMLVYRTKFGYTHTSVWYFRWGNRKHALFTGAKQAAIHKQLELAGAPIGLPGDRGSFFQIICFLPIKHSPSDTIKRSRILLCGKGSQELMAQHHDTFNEPRRERRLQDRKYLSSTLHWREFTFP